MRLDNSLTISPKMIHRRRMLRLNWQNKRSGGFFWPRRAWPSNNSIFAKPASWKFVVLTSLPHIIKKNTQPLIYLYTPTYYFTFSIPTCTKIFRVDKFSNTFFVSQKFWDFCYVHYSSSLVRMFSTLYLIFFTKMKFKGKGYYIYKNFRNTIAPKFGYYHRIYVYAYDVRVKFLSKTSVILFGFAKNDIMSVGHDFKSKKPINIFTGRGVRFARQVIYRKTGKVSTYR